MLTIQNDKGSILAYLNNLQNAKIREVLNGEYMLNFICTIDPLKTDYLYDNNNLICYNNDLFRISTLEELHNEDDMIIISVQAEHITYDLINNVMQDFNYLNKNATFVMQQALTGTGFNFIGTDITDFKTDIQYTQECNSKQVTIAIAHNWRGELKYFRHDIQLLKQRGTNRGVDFRFGKNLKSIKRIRNFAEDTTSYDVDVQQGTELEELAQYSLGDTVRVIDDRLNCDYECRIIEIEKDILTGLNSRVVLGNEIKDLRSSFNTFKKDIEEVKDTIEESAIDWNKIKDITDDLGNVIADKITGGMNTANVGIANTTGTIEWTGNTIKIHDQPKEDDSTWCMELGSFGWRIANGREDDNSWRFRTVATGEGIVADKVTASAIDGLTINGVTINASTLNGATLNGITINGATIYVGDKRAGNYIELSPNNPLKVFRNNILVSSLGYSDIGGGNLVIYDIGGTEAFHVECLKDGNLQLYANSDSGYIDDPDNPGFAIPNPNPRYMQVDAGRVVFPNWSAGEYNNDKTKFFRFVTEFDLKQFDSKLDSLQRQLDNKANQWHRHSCSSTNGHTHSIS